MPKEKEGTWQGVTSTGLDLLHQKTHKVMVSSLHPTHPNTTHRALTVLRDSQQGGEKVVSTDVPFELRGFSLATVGLGLGGIITIGSLAEVRQ